MRPKKGSVEGQGHVVDVGHVQAVRRMLERADFLLGLLDGFDLEGPWGAVHATALLDAGLDALQDAIDEIDRILKTEATS